MPVFMFTSASVPSSWFWPRVMRTLPPASLRNAGVRHIHRPVPVAVSVTVRIVT